MFGRRWGKEAGKTKGGFESLRAGKTSISFLIIYRPDLWQRISSTSVRIQTHPFSPFLNKHQDFKYMFSRILIFPRWFRFLWKVKLKKTSVSGASVSTICWGANHFLWWNLFPLSTLVQECGKWFYVKNMNSPWKILNKKKGNPLFLFLWTNWIRPISPFPLYFWTIIYSLHKWVFLIIWQSNCLYWIINTPHQKKKGEK